MHKLQTMLSGPLLAAPTVHGDERGFFLETDRRSTMPELDVKDHFVQGNHSRSRQDRSAPTLAQRKDPLPFVDADA